MEYGVLAILKNSKGKTLGIRITDGNNYYDVYKARLVNWYKNGVKFSNAILYANGFVRAKRGNLKIIVLKEEKHPIRKNTVNVEDKVILYHGSEIGIVGHVDIKYSNRLCDFGYGFYTSNDKRQAINRVCNYANSRLYTIELDLSGASIYKFTDETLWALYIGVNRGKIDLVDYPKLKKIINYINSHDIIIGLIANDKIGNCYSMFLDNYITNEALCKCLSYAKFGNQLVIKNQKNGQYLFKEALERSMI